VSPYIVVRYTSAGVIDSGFGTGGIATVQVSSNYNDQATGGLLPADGKILVCGATGPAGGSDAAMIRLLTDGTPDDEFGTDGIVITDFGGLNDMARSVALQSNGRIVVGGQTDAGFVAARYDNVLDVGMSEISAPTGTASIHPSPLADRSTLSYSLTADADLSIGLFDARGRFVRTLAPRTHRAAGAHEEVLDFTALPSGNYQIVLDLGGSTMIVRAVK
jgi:uncharacterized delta-60 repeat protein